MSKQIRHRSIHYTVYNLEGGGGVRKMIRVYVCVLNYQFAVLTPFLCPQNLFLGCVFFVLFLSLAAFILICFVLNVVWRCLVVFVFGRHRPDYH